MKLAGYGLVPMLRLYGLLHLHCVTQSASTVLLRGSAQHTLACSTHSWTPLCSMFWQTNLPASWLSVLANIEPPAFRAAEDRLIDKIMAHNSWPIYLNISNRPSLHVTSRKSLWQYKEPTDIKHSWSVSVPAFQSRSLSWSWLPKLTSNSPSKNDWCQLVHF